MSNLCLSVSPAQTARVTRLPLIRWNKIDINLAIITLNNGYDSTIGEALVFL